MFQQQFPPIIGFSTNPLEGHNFFVQKVTAIVIVQTPATGSGDSGSPARRSVIAATR